MSVIKMEEKQGYFKSIDVRLHIDFLILATKKDLNVSEIF